MENNVLDGFLASMFELASGTGPWKIEENTVNSVVFKGLGEIRDLEWV